MKGAVSTNSDRPLLHTVYKHPMDDEVPVHSSRRTIPTELGYKDVSFPKGDSYLVSSETQATVLDQFYFIVVFGCFPPPFKTGFDPKKVLVNPDDAQVLWDTLYSHYRKFFKHAAAQERAQDVWDRFSPTMDVNLPRGTVRLLDGYIRFA